MTCFISMGQTQGQAAKRSREHVPPQVCPLGMLIGQSRGCSLLHPRVMGQVLVSAPPGCNSEFQESSSHPAVLTPQLDPRFRRDKQRVVEDTGS